MCVFSSFLKGSSLNEIRKGANANVEIDSHNGQVRSRTAGYYGLKLPISKRRGREPVHQMYCQEICVRERKTRASKEIMQSEKRTQKVRGSRRRRRNQRQSSGQQEKLMENNKARKDTRRYSILKDTQQMQTQTHSKGIYVPQVPRRPYLRSTPRPH